MGDRGSSCNFKAMLFIPIGIYLKNRYINRQVKKSACLYKTTRSYTKGHRTVTRWMLSRLEVLRREDRIWGKWDVVRTREVCAILYNMMVKW